MLAQGGLPEVVRRELDLVGVEHLERDAGPDVLEGADDLYERLVAALFDEQRVELIGDAHGAEAISHRLGLCLVQLP